MAHLLTNLSQIPLVLQVHLFEQFFRLDLVELHLNWPTVLLLHCLLSPLLAEHLMSDGSAHRLAEARLADADLLR